MSQFPEHRRAKGDFAAIGAEDRESMIGIFIGQLRHRRAIHTLHVEVGVLTVARCW